MRHVDLADEFFALALLAEAYAGAGAMAHARRNADEAVECARQLQVPVPEIYARLARARVLRMTDGAASAPRIADDLPAAEALISRTEAHAYTSFIHEQRAELARLIGDGVKRQRELREAPIGSSPRWARRRGRSRSRRSWVRTERNPSNPAIDSI